MYSFLSAAPHNFKQIIRGVIAQYLRGFYGSIERSL